MKRENNSLANFKNLHETQLQLAAKEIAKANELSAQRESFTNNYHIIRDMKARKDREHGLLMEAARNDAFSRIIKAIYITALEAGTLTDDAILLAESMVDKWIKEEGGTSAILANIANDTYIISRITQIVENYANAEVALIEEANNEELKAAKDAAENSAKVLINNADKKDIKDFVNNIIDNIQDKAESDAEEKKAEEEAPVEEAEPTESEEKKESEDTTEEAEAAPEEKESEPVESEEEKKESEDANEDANDVEVDVEPEKDTEVTIDKESDSTDKADEESKSEDSNDDEELDIEIEDDSDDKEDKEDASEDKEETPAEDKDNEGESSSEDSSEEADALEDVDDDTEDPSLNTPADDGVDDTNVTIDGDLDNDGKVFDDLEKEDDIQKAIDLIRTRVADAEEAFIRNNAEDKKKVDELINKISTNVKAVEDLNDKNDVKSETKKEIAHESVRMGKRAIDDIRDNRPLTIFEKMTRNLTSSIVTNESVIELYQDENGSLDTGLVVESAKVMYAFLETINTLQLANVNEEYIAKVLSNM